MALGRRYRWCLGEQQRSEALNYLVAVAVTAAAVLVRWQLNPLLDHRLPFITLYAALAVAVWFGGWKPALFVLILGYIAKTWCSSKLNRIRPCL